MMQKLALVFMGGGLGAVIRWQISALIIHRTADWRLPLATLVVNIIGCVIAGVVAGLAIKLDLLGADTRLFVITGVLGGFTTFSAFGLETVYLLQRHEYGVAMAYMLLSVAGGIGALWLALSVIPGRG